MKLKNRIAAALLCAATVVAFCPAGVANATEVNTYTYNYDYWGIEYESPDVYEASDYIRGEALGIGDFRQPQSIYVRDDKIYVADTGNNRIVELKVDGATVEVVRVITEFKGDVDVKTFLNPYDVFVNADGEIMIADMDNQRVVHLDKDLNLIKLITQPTDEPTVDTNLKFLPTKVVMDRAGRAFVLVKNVNRGFMWFESDGSFINYVGASEVVFSMADYIKKLISTQEQRAQMASFVPTEYNNLCIDKDGFIYCTTSVFEEHEVASGEATPIRKLNSLGGDILVRNGNLLPYGDDYWDEAGGMVGPSRLIDITVFDNETYYALDRVRGRIFGYDDQGNLLFAFGGVGNKMGYFQNPVAIDHMGSDLFVLDAPTGAITRFRLTEFGSWIQSALEEYEVGDYEESAVYWTKVLEKNGNYDLAYVGIGRALLRQGKYEEAMEYFEVKRDDDNYSRAWKYYRKDWIENNLGYVIVVVVALAVVLFVVKAVKKVKKEALEEYELEIELERRNK